MKHSVDTCQVSSLKPVCRIDKEGNVLEEYPTIKAASKKTKISDSNISSACKNKVVSAGGEFWRYKEDLDYNIKSNDNFTRIRMLDNKGNFVREFDSVKDATLEMKLPVSSILRGISKSKDYIFEYIEPPKKKAKPSKAVNQFDKEGNFITTFSNAVEALKHTGINSSDILGVCRYYRNLSEGKDVTKNKKAFAGGFAWSYSDKISISQAKPKVYRYDIFNNKLIDTFMTLEDASKELGVHSTTICKILKGTRAQRSEYILRDH